MIKDSLALGDLHIGRKHKVTYGDPLIWDLLSLNVLGEMIAKYHPKTLILTGDVFDSSRPTALDFARLVSVIVSIPRVIILTGNHDLSMVTEEIAFQHLGSLENVELVQANTYSNLGWNTYGVGWCDTQELFEKTMAMAIEEASEYGTIFAHCNRKYWENDNDNSFTDALYDLASEKHVMIVSGHEHQSSQSKSFVHLGSLVPQASNQLNTKLAMVTDDTGWKFENVPNYATTYEADDALLYFLKEEPLAARENCCIMVKPEKEVKPEDLKLEGKDLTIDIIDSFRSAAVTEGFSKELIDAYI